MGPGQVSHFWFGFEFGKFPLRMSNFSIFSPSDQKNLLGQVKKYTFKFYWINKNKNGKSHSQAKVGMAQHLRGKGAGGPKKRSREDGD